jgi:EmrB/QacA subfamily drug resistance transporter
MTPDRPFPAAAMRSAVSTRTVMTGALLAILLGALEQSVLAVAVPAIATQLNGFELMAWIMAAYLVASTVVTPIYGTISDIYGRRTTLTWAIVIYLLATIGCMQAGSIPELIAFRAIQGIGGGGLIAVAQATIADVVPLRERGRYQGYISGVWATAYMGAPIIGGYLTNYFSWRAIFMVNFGVGLVALFVVRHTLRGLSIQSRAPRKIDFAGALLLATGLTAILIAVTRVGQGVALQDPGNAALALCGAAFLLAFCWHEQRAAEPLIPLAMLGNPTVALCCVTLFMTYVQFVSLSVLLPLRLQMVGGVGAAEAALRLLPLTLTVALGTFGGGLLLTKYGRYKPLQVAGALAATLAGFAFAFVEPHQTWLMAVVTGVLGFGVGLQIPTGIVAIQNAVPPSQIGLATALAGFSRLLGGAVGIAVFTAALLALLRHAVPASAGLSAGAPTGTELFQSLIANSSSPDGATLRHVADGAFRTLFIILASSTVISPLLLFRLRERDLGARAVASGAPPLAEREKPSHRKTPPGR